MRFHVDVRAPFGLLVLVSMLAGCDPKSTEVGATVGNLGASTSGDGSGSGSSGDDIAGSMDCAPGEVALLSGTVERELGEHTWNEDFEATPEAFVHLLLVIDNPDDTWTGTAERLVPFEGLPFEFALCIPDTVPFKFEADLDYDFWLHVYNHDASELRVGDLADVDVYPVDRPTHGMEIVVAGVEHCDDPNADDLCSEIE